MATSLIIIIIIIITDISKCSTNRLTVTKAHAVTTSEQSGTKQFSAIV